MEFDTGIDGKGLAVDDGRMVGDDFGVGDAGLNGYGEATAIGRTDEEAGAELLKKALLGLIVETVAVKVVGEGAKGEAEKEKE